MTYPNVDVMDVCSPDKQEELITWLAHSDAHFKSQQRDEPDLSIEEKKTIANNCLERSPVNFLCRFGKFLLPKHLNFFEPFSSDYEVAYYLDDLRDKLDPNFCKHLIKNRRYAALNELMEKTDYFSEEAMNLRNPLLYEQMIGKYLTEEERLAHARKKFESNKYSKIIMDHMDKCCLYRYQADKEHCQEEEEEDEEEEEEEEEGRGDEEEEGNMVEQKAIGKAKSNAFSVERPKISSDMASSTMWASSSNQLSSANHENPSEEEREFLKREFLHFMQESFLEGKDEDFDYEAVDNNTKYDYLVNEDRDAEDSYFDSEEPS